MCEKEIATVNDEREKYLIEDYTGKSVCQVLNDYTLPELIRLCAYVDFIKSL